MFGCGLVVYLVVIGWFVWLFAFAVHPRRSAPPPPAGDTVALLHDVLRQRGKPLLRSLRSSRLRPSTIPAGGWHENEVPSTIPRWRDGNKTKCLLLSPAGGGGPDEGGTGGGLISTPPLSHHCPPKKLSSPFSPSCTHETQQKKPSSS